MVTVKNRSNAAKQRMTVAKERLTKARANALVMEQIVVELQAEQAKTAVAEGLLIQSRDHLAQCEAVAARVEAQES